MKKNITLEDIQQVIEFNKKNQVVVEPEPEVETIGTVVKINGKLYLENEHVYEDGSRFKSSHAITNIEIR